MIVPQDPSYPFGAEQYFAFEQAYGSDFGGPSSAAAAHNFGQDETSRFYASQLGLSRAYLNYNGLPHEELAQVFAS